MSGVRVGYGDIGRIVVVVTIVVFIIVFIVV